MNPKQQALLEICRMMENARLDYMVVGALAVSVHGEPRATKDIDLVVDLPFEERKVVSRLLDEKDWPWEEWVDPEWGKRLMASHPSKMRLEIFFAPKHELFQREMSRKKWLDYAGQRLPFISAEDLILRKLVNTRIRRGHDYDDALGVVLGQGDGLDKEYIREHCAVHRVCEQFDRLLQEAERLAAGEKGQ